MFNIYKISSVVSKQCFLTSCRLNHNEIRVRFAPSPTGLLHLGGLRTALFNYLFAKSQNGKFLLRIEDTDRTRLVPGAKERIIEDIMWSGIKVDEGPSFGGEFGPYVQSERIDIYQEAVHKLIENGTAYRCFCTERRLDLLRKEAIRTRHIPRYDNKCRYLTPKQIAELLLKSIPYCVRFALKSDNEPVNDLIYGKITHSNESEGDPVIIKTDGYPTYHFANIVDDHYMGITHVLRGVEWQISTGKHLQMYKAFDWKPPEFGHLPLLVNADGTKLSKRQGDISIDSLRSQGYYSNALINYVTSAGGGFSDSLLPELQNRLFTLPELSQKFDITKVNTYPSRLNPDLLNNLNRLHIKQLLEKEETSEELIQSVQKLVVTAYPKEPKLDLDDKHVLNVLKWSLFRMSRLQDLISEQLNFLWVKPATFRVKGITENQLLELLKELEVCDFTKESLNELLRKFAESKNLKFPIVMKVLRAALSGLKEGPGVSEMMHILGKEVVAQRIKDAIANQNKPIIWKLFHN